MTRRKTPEEYYNECKERGLDLPIEDYKTKRIKIKFKCSKGHIYDQLPYAHTHQGHGCPYCSGNHSYTSKEYYNLCKERGLDLPIEDYITTAIKIKHKCSKGHIYNQRPSSHLKGYGCRLCSDRTRAKVQKKTPAEYIQECKENGYDLPLEDYINAKTKIKHKCSKGHIYKQIPSSHLNGQGCKLCRDMQQRYTPKEYYSLCKEKGLDLPIEDYVNAATKIKHKCSKGHVYPQVPSSHLKGQGCSTCSKSHGEKFIAFYLDTHNIKYKDEMKFKECKDNKPLPFDFCLPDYNILIEYQGEQHFEYKDFFYKDTQELKDRKHKDYLKAKYAKTRGIKLLRPTYKTDTQEKMNRYLDRYLKIK